MGRSKASATAPVNNFELSDVSDSGDDSSKKRNNVKGAKGSRKKREKEQKPVEVVEEDGFFTNTGGSYNWGAILILACLIIPIVTMPILSIYDSFYPEAVQNRIAREKVTRCYAIADPSKLGNIDNFMEKYAGKEHKLFTQLRNKYGAEFPECDLRPEKFSSDF
jgi:hypothetical protein